MACERAERSPRLGVTDGDTTAPALKILVAGGFGVGKTTLVGAVSELRPPRKEELLREAGRPVDDTDGIDRKVTTAVAMDFGRITIRSGLSLYPFGTPGQDRFRPLWDELAQGALGAVVLADTRRLPDCFPVVDYVEHRRVPFVVAVNCSTGAPLRRPGRPARSRPGPGDSGGGAVRRPGPRLGKGGADPARRVRRAGAHRPAARLLALSGPARMGPGRSQSATAF